MPTLGLSRVIQITEMATHDEITGMKNSVRKMKTPRSFWFMTTAMSKLITIPSGTDNAV